MGKIKILLLNPPYKEIIIRDNYCCFTSKSGYFWPPIDLLYLSAILRDVKIQLQVIDAIAEEKTWNNVLKIIEKNKPDIIIALTGAASYKEDLEGLAKIKNSKIYLMGNMPAFQPEYFFKKYPFIEGIIHNFYDQKIRDYLIKGDLSCESVSFKKNKKKIKLGKINYLKPLSKIKLGQPPQYNFFPIEKYSTPIAQKKPIITMMTSFGCPFHCKFCVASALTYYSRELEDLEKEFNAIKKAGIKEIFFEDSTFNAYLPHTSKICQLLIDKNYQFSWSANVHSFNLTENLLNLMKKAGCHTVQIGVESGDKNILLEYAPSKRINTLKKAFTLCKKAGIRTMGYFIIGFPNETKRTAMKTIEFAKKLDPNFASFSVLTPDYGTKLRQELLARGIINEKEDGCFDSSGEAVLNNPKFSKKDQNNYIKKAYWEFYSQPHKLLSYLVDYKKFFIYLKNAIHLFFKKIVL